MAAELPGEPLAAPADGWPAAQVTWVARRLGGLLAGLHGQGRLLGPVRAWDLDLAGEALVAPDPLPAVPPGWEEAADAAHLARLLRSLLGVHPPSYLLGLLLDAAPAADADPAAVQAWLRCFEGLGPGEPPVLATPPAPPAPALAVLRPAAAGPPRRPRLRRPRLRWPGRPGRVLGLAAGGLAFVGLLAAGAVAGARSAGGPGPSEQATAVRPPAVAAPRPSPEWAAVLAALDARRDLAFVAGDLGLLDGVYLPGSVPGRADRRNLADLVGRGLHAVGLRLEVRSVRVLASAPRSARLHVVDRLPAYAVVDAGGAVVARQPGRGDAGWIIDLAATPGGWRISGLRPAPNRTG